MSPLAICPCCKTSFSLEDLLTHPDVVPIGMLLQDDFAKWNSYYFNHVAADCGTTCTVNVEKFASLLHDDVPEAVRALSRDCEGHCTSLGDVAECGAHCRWAPYRRLLRTLMERGARA